MSFRDTLFLICNLLTHPLKYNMKLYLMRHGEALNLGLDCKCSLSPKGKQETEAIAAFIGTFNLQVEWMHHSDKTRAVQTAEIIGRKTNIPLKLLPGLHPNDPVEPFIFELGIEDKNRFLVGHLPFLEKLVGELLIEQENCSLINFSPSTLVCLEKTDRVFRIKWVICPNLLIHNNSKSC